MVKQTVFPRPLDRQRACMLSPLETQRAAMARICFLFNHDELHQIAHSLPIALELAKRGEHEVIVAAGLGRIADALEQEIALSGITIPLVRLTLKRTSSKLLAATLDKLLPASKILLYRDNIDFFRSFDAVVVSEKTTLLLKSRYGLDKLRIIHTRHGAGDRAIGFNSESAQFDLVLVSGPKIARRLEREAGLDPRKIRITGYAKFDFHGDNRIANPFPDKNRPIVLYAPHPSPKLSSYFRYGEEILGQFAASDRYNLIFAPHVMLFKRGTVVTISPPAIQRVPPVPEEIGRLPHIHVDTGSTASVDMSYTNLADVYCGDASSQVYEFLLHPRPVIHVDAHDSHWRGNPNYRHWDAGPVVSDPSTIIDAVDRAIASHGNYLSAQREMLAESFSVTDLPASVRAAKAIDEFLRD